MDNSSLTSMEILFASLLKGDDGVFRRKNEVVMTFKNSPDVFRDEYYVFFLIIKEFPKVIPDIAFVNLFLRTNRSVLSKNKYIDLARFRVGDTDPYVEFANSCINIFNELWNVEVTDADFYRSLEMVKMEYINSRSITLLEEGVTILTDGLKTGKGELKGYHGMRKHLNSGFTRLDNIVNKTDRRGIITLGEDMEDENNDQIRLVTTFGIKALDEKIGGLYEGDMLSLLAPAKGCKSRFVVYVCHNAVVNHGENIVVWPIENGTKGWEYLIRARHFNWFYNSKVSDVTQKRIIDDDMIRKGELSDELAEMERVSWTDLKINTQYGKISLIDEDFDLDTFIDVLDQAVNEYGAKLVAIDYLQLIGGGNRNLSKNERIAEAYKRLLQYLKKKKIAGIFPAQLKQTVVSSIKNVSPDELINMELRDAAGESYEVIKTPDLNLALYGTVEDIRNGEMKLLSIPSRNVAPFDPINLYVDAGSCTFASVDEF